jgi:hypothetical protein
MGHAVTIDEERARLVRRRYRYRLGNGDFGDEGGEEGAEDIDKFLKQ